MKRTAAAFLAAVCFMLFGCAPEAYTPAEGYTDVLSGAWYFENVSEMSEKGLLLGYEDGTFKPEERITYAEFATVLKRCVTGSADSGQGHWASETMLYARDNGWYDYDEINESVYDAPIPRYMAVKLTVLAFDIPHNENDDGVYWRYMNEIRDFNGINGRYAYLVVRAYNNGILTGDENGNFNPDASLTRAEACALVSRAAGMVKGELPTAQPTLPSAARSGGASENGALRVEGTQLVNAAGEPVVLRGMSTHGLQWFAEFASRESIAKTADAGANLFRIAMYTAEGGYLSAPDMMKQRLYTAADAAIDEDMYVIIDWHILSDGDPMTHADEAAAFFDEVSARYASSPNVLYEICNEPNGGITWEGNVKPYAERIIPVIRANDPDSVILVGSPTWSQDIDKAAADPLAFENIMYTCHFYAGTHTQWLRDRIDDVRSKGLAVFVSEWGTSAADGNGGVFLDEAQRWVDFMNERNISWANWSLCDKAESSAAVRSGAGSLWSAEDLSESGQLVFGHFTD